jgi:hypothetical protein
MPSLTSISGSGQVGMVMYSDPSNLETRTIERDGGYALAALDAGAINSMTKCP